MKLVGGFLVLLSTIAPVSGRVKTCESRLYCKTSEIKFMAMEEIQGAYLNTTAIQTHITKNITHCQRFCLKTEKCFSLNLNMTDPESLGCQLLEGNLYTNASSLVTKANHVHLYIPSKCKDNPCLNGGTCIPSYKDDTFSCRCKTLNAWIIKGKHCETVLTGYDAANMFWPFDSNKKEAALTRGVSSESSDLTPTQLQLVAMDPGRKTPVAHCKATSTTCIEFERVPCLNSFTSACQTVTYSVWLKFSNKEATEKHTRSIISSELFTYKHIRFRKIGAGLRFEIAVSAGKKWYLDRIGSHIDQSLWNHFAFTIDDSKEMCAYVNGKQQKCDRLPTTVALSAMWNEVKVGGGYKSTDMAAMSVDELAIWKKTLTPEEIKLVYERSKAGANQSGKND